MPSSMIHLLTAYKYDPTASIEFYIGNIAPDCVRDKDKLHFRHSRDRLIALKDFALSIDFEKDYYKGILLHLFLDYYWDIEAILNFRITCKQEDWYPNYREEISLAGAWIFHKDNFWRELFLEMKLHPIHNDKIIQEIKVDDLQAFINRNYEWHIKNKIGPSTIYTPSYIDAFTCKVVSDFRKWIKYIYI